MTEEGSIKQEEAGYFRLCAEGRAFVTKLKGNPQSANFGVVMEFYWLCVQLGLVAYSKDDSRPEPAGADNEVYDAFAGETRKHQVLQRAFVMYGYLHGLGYEEFDERMSEPIEKAMDDFLQMTGTHLTNRGLKEMDTFAQKGWDIIHAKGIDRANTLSRFLTKYVETLMEYA